MKEPKSMKTIHHIFIIALVLFSIKARSQEKIATDSAQLVIINVGVRGMWQTGRTNQLDIAPNLKFQLLKKGHYFEQLVEYQYLTVNKFTIIHDFWSNSLFQLKQDKRFFPFITAAGGTARSFLLNRFILTGSGIGSNIYRKSITEYLQLHLFVGYLNYSLLNFAHQAFSVGSIIRSNISLSKKVQLNWDFTSYHSTALSSSWGLQNNVKLNFLVGKNLRLNLNHRLFYNQQTIEGITKLNTIFLLGINYQFRKEKTQLSN